MQIKLGDREYEIKYPFAACREMERASGRSITTFASETIARASSGEVSFDDITLLVWGGILHSRRNITLDQVAIQLEGAAENAPLLNIFIDCAEELRKSLDAKLKFEEPEDKEKN
ncbi:hypothetical protein [Cloacibacillus porcorum]|uniref:hypothetical protein n=1 Tax=Cloacibacillus porcorum TaxID=1197717 RepID=UPI0023F53AB3|nr:hypothetical protein [Cloacibacillus porcorum]MCC8185009.1 hypothetical protein [Cloacibacillus porcorum]